MRQYDQLSITTREGYDMSNKRASNRGIEGAEELWPHQAFWLDDEGHRWLVTAWLGRIGDRIEVVGMDARSFRHERESQLEQFLPLQEDAVILTAKIWRSIGALKERIRTKNRQELSDSGLLAGPDRDVLAAWNAPVDLVASRHNEIAYLYKQARLAGKKPVDLVMEELFLSRSAANKRIQRARHAGALPPAGPGRPRKSA